LTSEDGTIVCNVGGGNMARDVYRIVSSTHTDEVIGYHEKNLLHGVDEEESSSDRNT